MITIDFKNGVQELTINGLYLNFENKLWDKMGVPMCFISDCSPQLKSLFKTWETSRYGHRYINGYIERINVYHDFIHVIISNNKHFVTIL